LAPLPDYFVRNWVPLDDEPEERGPRVVIWDGVFAGIQRHTASDLENEVAGFLLGSTFASDEQPDPVIVIQASLVAKHVETGAMHVEFTHDTWTTFHEEWEASHGDKRIVGWYHTHPNIGIFLSKYDTFIHHNFFKESDRVALVIDPVQLESGFFKRVDGELDPRKPYGFMELSAQVVSELEPGRNLRLRGQVLADESVVFEAAYRPGAVPHHEAEPPALGDVAAMVESLVVGYWRRFVPQRIRSPLSGLLRQALAGRAGALMKALAPVAGRSGPPLKSLSSRALREVVEERAAPRAEAGASTAQLSMYKEAQGRRLHVVGLRTGWWAALIATYGGIAVLVGAALLAAPLWPLAGSMDSWPQWVIAALLLAGAGVLAAAQNGLTLPGNAQRLPRRIEGWVAIRVERTLARLIEPQ
jgi:proteasome lid subunit RPN8/RPN11